MPPCLKYLSGLIKPHLTIIFAFYYSTQHVTFEDQLVQLYISGFLFLCGNFGPKNI